MAAPPSQVQEEVPHVRQGQEGLHNHPGRAESAAGEAARAPDSLCSSLGALSEAQGAEPPPPVPVPCRASVWR